MKQISRQELKREEKARAARAAARAAEAARAEDVRRQLAASRAYDARVRAETEAREAERATIAAALVDAPEWLREACSYAKLVEPGEVPLKHIYGRSYFGSGGASGSVRCYGFDGSEAPLDVAATGDNGFIRGPAAVRVKHGQVVIARGSDCIGDGRSWGEVYVCLGVQ